MRNDIDRDAADWAARTDGATLDAVETAQFETWLAADERHFGAYARARAMLAHLDRAQALGPDFQADGFTSARLSRRRALQFGGGAIAATVAAAIGTGMYFRIGVEHVSTARGEIRRVPLPDGSSVTLNTETRLAVEFSEQMRHVRLLKGEALFDVAKDAARPFVVEASGTRVTAIGTSFTVHKLQGKDVEVLVREGVVEMARPALAEFTPVRLVANTIGYAEPDKPVKTVSIESVEIFRKLVWRDGMIAFNGETLTEAAAAFARYSDLRITIDDPAVAARTVTGLFSANDPAGFAKAVAGSFGLKAERSGGKVLLSKPHS